MALGFMTQFACLHADENSESSSSAQKETVWVAQSDGAKSCAPGSGSDLAQGAEALKVAHIPVLESRKGTDGKLHAQMCGASKGSENAYLILKEYLPLALTLGYKQKK